MGVPSNFQLLAERDHLRSLAEEKMNKRSTAPLGVYVFSSDDPGAELARSVEAEVFLDTFGNTPEQLAAEYSPYEGRTVFLCVIDHLRRAPAAAMRIIVPTADGRLSKSLDDMERHWGIRPTVATIRNGVRFPFFNTWDIATLAVSHSHQGRATAGLVSMALYEAYVRGSRECGYDYVVAILDKRAYRFSNWVFRDTWAPFDGTDAIPYLGSPSSLPVWSQLSDWGARLKEGERSIYELVFESRGFENVVDLASERALCGAARRILDSSRADQAVIDLRDGKIADPGSSQVDTPATP